MKKILLSVLLLALAEVLFSQAIVKGGGIIYTNGAPTHTPAQATDAEVAIDTTSGLWYEWARDVPGWNAAGFRIQKLAGSSAPVGAPTDKESEVLLNDVDSLYRWRAGAWQHLNKVVTYSAGTGISISGGNVISNTGDLSATNEGILGVGAGGATSSTILSNTSGATGVTISVTGIATISESTSSNGGTITIGATEVDGSVSNELQTFGHAGTTSYTNTLSNGGGSFTLQASGIASISHTAGTVTISATEVDGSVTNELQTVTNTSDATSHTATLSNSGGSLQLVEGANITLTTSGTGLDGIVTIAATSGSGTDLTYTGASSPVTLNSSSGADVTFAEGGIVTLSATGTELTISATEVDGSVTNELQTVTNTSDATSHTVTLSNSGGSLQLVEGANITLTTSGTGSDGVVTIASTGGGGATDLSYTGASSPVTLNSSTGNDVTFAEGGIVSLSATGTELTISATEVDGSVSNELQTFGHAGTTSYTNTLSNGGGSFTLQASGIAAISHTAGTVTISATEVDGSTSNEGSLSVVAGGANDSQIASNTSGSTNVTVSGGTNVTVTEAGSTITVAVPALDPATIDATGGGPGENLIVNEAGTAVEFQLASKYLRVRKGSAGTITAGTPVYVTGFNPSGFIEVETADQSDPAKMPAIGLAFDAVTNASDARIILFGLFEGLNTSSYSEGDLLYVSNAAGAGIPWITSTRPTTGLIQFLGEVTRSNVSVGSIVVAPAERSDDVPNFSAVDKYWYGTTGGQVVEGTVTSFARTLLDDPDAATALTTLGADPSVTNEGSLSVVAGGANDSQIASNTSGSTNVTIAGGANVTVTESGSTITIAATSGGGSDLSYTGASSPVTLNSSTGTDVTFTEGGIVTLSATGTDLTISATEVDGSVSNELQTVNNTSDATSHTVTLSNSGGSVQLVEGANITLTTSGTGLDGIVTIAATSGGGTDLSYSGASSPVTLASSSGTDVTFAEGGIVTLSATGTELTISATEVDGSTSNELQTYGHAGTTSYTNTLSNGGGSFTLQAAGIASISHTAGTVTISATEVDGSTSNELQTVNNTSDATSHTVTLSNSGGSVQLVEGANITLTTSGTGLDGIVTIAATSGGGTDLSYSGASSPVTLVSSSGNDVTFTEGGIVTLTATGTDLTISATEVDGSTSNELQTYGHAGTTSYTNTLSNGGGSFTLQASGIASISHTGGTVTIGATEVDGSVSNELQTVNNTSDATSHTVTLSNSGGSVQLVEGANITLTTTGTGLDGIVTIAATSGGGSDLSYTGATSPVTLNSSTGTDVTFTEGGIVTLTATGTDLTISATEVDGSTSNELQTYGHAGTTSYTNTLSNGGGSFTLNAGGIASISHTAGTVTISATEVDGSVSNELQTLANTSDATSHTVTLSNSGGSVQLVEGTGITLTTSGTGLDGIVTIASTATGNTDLTFSGAGSPVTLNSSTGTDVTFTEGGIVSLSATGTNITITATEVDGSTSNELQTFGHAGTTSYTNTLSNGGGSFTLQASGIAAISHTAGTVTISATEVDGSVSNELQTVDNTSDATSHTVTLSNSGGSLQLVEGANVTLTTSGTGLNGIVTIAATSGGGTDFASIRGYVEGVTGTSVDLDALDGNTKDVDGTNLAFDVPSNLNNFKVFKNGIELNRTGTGTTRDYSADAGTNVLTLTTALTTADRLIVQAITGSTLDLITSARFTGAGVSGDPLELAQQAATSGQVLAWNGSSWAPRARQLQVKGMTVQNPTSSENISLFYIDRAITIDKVADAVQGTTPSVTYNIRFASTRNSGAPTDLFTANRTVTSSAGTTTQTFNDNTIPAGSWVWLITSAQSGTVNDFHVTLQYTED